VNRAQVLGRLDKAWLAFKESFAGLSEAELLEPNVTGTWSVRDILAHVTTWDEEALKYLPLILEGGKPPRYSVAYGGIDAFNARMTEAKRGLTLSQVLAQMDHTHQQVIDLVARTPEEQLATETRFCRRLRLDTYSHYPTHADAIRSWRSGLSSSPIEHMEPPDVAQGVLRELQRGMP
jgi:hypothetical protein